MRDVGPARPERVLRTRKPTFHDILPPESWADTAETHKAFAYAGACVRTLRDAVLAMLEEPALTRRQLRARLIAVAKQIETWGPDAPFPAIRFIDLDVDKPGPVAAPTHWEYLHLRRLSGETDESYQLRVAEAAPRIEAYWAEASGATSLRNSME